MISFAHPWFFLLLILPVLAYFSLPRAKGQEADALKIPFIADLQNIADKAGGAFGIASFKIKRLIQIILIALSWFLLCLALARPQIIGDPVPVKNNGRDILLVLDISTSMNEHDFVYNQRYYDRLSAVKFVVDKFIDARTEDRIGLVLFGTRAYLQSPLTYDKKAIKEILRNIEAGMAGNSTSIGDAIGLALKNMANEKPDDKIIILLTDGENNDGKLSLPEAIKLAKDENVKVYTIGVGADEKSFFGGFFSVPLHSGLDEKSLQALAAETKGQYFRAKDVDSLHQIYKQIDKLEPSEKEERFVREVKELYYIPAFMALLILGIFFALNAYNGRKK